MRQPIKTLIELYDKQPMENILGACIFSPAMVVYVCDARDSSLRKEMAVERLFKSRKMKTKARFYYIDTCDPQMIWNTFDAIVHDYPNCVFDCTGGKDLVLLQAGLYCREKNIPTYYIDPIRGKFVNVIGCDYLRDYYAMPRLSAEDLLAIAGARLIGYGHYEPEALTEDFEQDVFRIWPVVCRNPGAWGKLVAFDRPENLEKRLLGSNEITVVTDVPPAEARALLNGVAELTDCTAEERADGLTALRLKTDCTELHQVSREIFFAFAGAGKALLELSLKKASLEDVFLELTEHQEPPAAEPDGAEQPEHQAETEPAEATESAETAEGKGEEEP